MAERGEFEQRLGFNLRGHDAVDRGVAFDRGLRFRIDVKSWAQLPSRVRPYEAMVSHVIVRIVQSN
nr:hypothetical protein [Brevibacterium linens]